MIIDLIKTVAPGTALFFMLLAAAGALLMVRRGWPRRLGIAGILLLAASYCTLALPWTAERLSASLARYDQLRDPHDAQGAAAIVVLGGDSQPARVVETLRLNALVRPPWVVVSGAPEQSDAMRDELVAGGVNPRQILLEQAAGTTREQAINIDRLVRSHGITRIVLVASAIHMPRALAAVRATGLDAVPSASATWQIADLPRLWPAHDALRLSRESLYEHVALEYYRSKGWLGVAR